MSHYIVRGLTNGNLMKTNSEKMLVGDYENTLEFWKESVRLWKEESEELEAKNGELEKRNGMLAHQLKYAETILTEVQADKFKLREKLEIACEALEWISKTEMHAPIKYRATKALAAINKTGASNE